MDAEVDYEKLKRRPLGDHEISTYLNGNIKILKYNGITDYKNIEDLLNPYGAVVIFAGDQARLWSLDMHKNDGKRDIFLRLLRRLSRPAEKVRQYKVLEGQRAEV